MTISATELQRCALFADLTPQEITKLCDCLNAHERKYARDEYVFSAEDDVRFVYVLLSGSAHIVDEDLWGNRAIVETLMPQTLFGEAYIFSGAVHHLVSVVAAEPTTLLVIDPERLFESCSNACACHTTLIKNCVGILSHKIVRLTEKLGDVAQRTTREKVLSYLSRCARRERSDAFDIPYSRQQLADYLCVERSALSHELSRLQSAGLIRYRKNHFELLGR